MKTNIAHPKSVASLCGVVAAALAFLLAATVGSARAAEVKYWVAWWGLPLGNTASAEAIITIDTALVPNPGAVGGAGIPIAGSFVKDITISVSGASAGNGVFLTADFGKVFWDTNGGTLDLNKELVGQATSGSAWGNPTNGGDFNLGSTSNGPPTGLSAFKLATNSGGPGDPMQLVIFTPIYTDTRLGITREANVGDDIYNPMDWRPQLDVAVRRSGGVKRVFFLIQNDGPAASSFKVQGVGSSPRFTIRYFKGDKDVTAIVVAGNFDTGELAPGSASELKAVITAKTSRVGKTYSFGIRAESMVSHWSRDTAVIRVRSRR